MLVLEGTFNNLEREREEGERLKVRERERETERENSPCSRLLGAG